MGFLYDMSWIILHSLKSTDGGAIAQLIASLDFNRLLPPVDNASSSTTLNDTAALSHDLSSSITASYMETVLRPTYCILLVVTTICLIFCLVFDWFLCFKYSLCCCKRLFPGRFCHAKHPPKDASSAASERTDTGDQPPGFAVSGTADNLTLWVRIHTRLHNKALRGRSCGQDKINTRKDIMASCEFLMVSSLVFVLFCCIAVTFFASIHTHTSLSTPPSVVSGPMTVEDHNGSLQMTQPDRNAVFPKISFSLALLKDYLENFGDRAKIDTLPTVHNMIRDTIALQKASSIKFNDILQIEMGTVKADHFSKLMSNYSLTLFEHMPMLADRITSQANAIHTRIEGMRHSWQEMASLDTAFANQLLYNNTNTTTTNGAVLFEMDFPESLPTLLLNCANSFVKMMAARGVTAESLVQGIEAATERRVNTTRDTNIRMAIEMDVPGSIGSKFNHTWDTIGAALQNHSTLLSNLEMKLSAEIFPATAAYRSFFSFVLFLSFFVTVLILMTAIIVIAQHFFCEDLLRKRFRVNFRGIISVLFVFLSFNFLLCLILLMSLGYAEIDYCRYLRPNVFSHYESLHEVHPYDKILNQKLDDIWPMVEDSYSHRNISPPRIRNILHGLVVNCQDNVGLLDALQASDKINFAEISGDELPKRFLAIGRKHMLSSLRNLVSEEIIPPKLRRDAAQSGALENFIDENEINSKVKEVQDFRLFYNLDNHQVVTVARNYQKHLQALVLAPNSLLLPARDLELARNMSDALESLFLLLAEFQSRSDALLDLPPVKPISDNLTATLQWIISLLDDKPRLLGMADDLFQSVSVASAAIDSRRLSDKYGGLIFKHIGHCQQLHMAYRYTVEGVCDDFLNSANGYWFWLGSASFVSIFVLFIVLILIASNRNEYFAGRICNPDVVYPDKLVLESLLHNANNGGNDNTVKVEPPAMDKEQSLVPDVVIGPEIHLST